MAKKKIKILGYTIVFMEEDNGEYSVSVPYLSGCHSQGDTFEKAKGNIAKAISLLLAI